MVKLLKFLGIASLISALVAGYMQASTATEVSILRGRIEELPFQWGIAFTWLISGLVTCILFFAFAIMLEKLENMEYSISSLKRDLAPPTEPTPKPNYAAKIPDSKMNLDSAKGFKMRTLD